MALVIGNKKIGYEDSVYIIAEGCDNHMGNIEVAKEMCLQAKLAGADAIKFQHHLPDEEMLKEVPMSSNFDIPLYDFLKLHALTLEQHKEIKQYCETIGIQYLCTPFSLKAAKELNDIGVEAFKIGSGEMTDIPSLIEIAKLGKPMIISTGMCTLEEIKETYDALVPYNVPLAFTNCLSEYPPRYDDLNLGVIKQLMEMFPKAIIGHSDHTPDNYTCYAAVALGARIIEKHVILNKTTPGPDQSVSIDFVDLHQLVDGIRKIECSMGQNKIVNDREKDIREWAFRSIVSVRKLFKGEVLQQDMIWSKRPGTGIPAKKMNDIIGKKLTRDVEANSLLSYDDFED